MTRRVRYRECDPMAYVYHTHYIDWFEEARTEALRELGLPYAELEASGLIMPVVDLAMKYHRPARYDERIEVITRIADEPPRMRVRFDYEAVDAVSREARVSGHVTLCFFDPSRGRPVPAPERVRTLFEELAS